jgi:acyl-coenzyme A synthetase/AMP-(fatty) acid ligase
MGSYAALHQVDDFISYFQLESVLHTYPKVLEAGVIIKRLKAKMKS